MLQRAAGNRAVTSMLRGRRGAGSGPVVGSPASDQERNAETVARAVVARLEAPEATGAGGSREAALPLARSGGESGTPVPVEIEGRLHSALGNGRTLHGDVRPTVERATGTDLSAVRVHDGPDAHELSGELGARAFTYGSDIFFARGAFDPSSAGGKELIAHELTHVAQGGGIERAVIHRSVETNGGTWLTNAYGPVKDGAMIELEFKPNDNVDAKKIGLIQRAQKVERGTNYDVKARADYEAGVDQPGPQKRKAQRSDGESHVDRDIRMNNPIYGAPDLGRNQDIGKTPTSELDMSDEAQRAGTASNYQLGWRYRSGLIRKTSNERSAKLYDKPNMPGATDAAAGNAEARSEMIFETTAVAIEGAQKGQYYGSVSWGFRIGDASGAVLEPLAVASEGATTAEMRQVMENWNEGETSEGQRNPQIPLPPED